MRTTSSSSKEPAVLAPVLAPGVALAPPGPDPIPAELRAVVALFDERLAGVSFPDVDAARLRGLADEVRRLGAEAEAARRTMQVAEAAAAVALEALRGGAARGLAYARIYATAAPERDGLVAAIDAVAAPTRATPTTDAVPRRRGRPRKDAAAQLFAVPSGAEVEAPAAPLGA